MQNFAVIFIKGGKQELNAAKESILLSPLHQQIHGDNFPPNLE